MSFHGQQPDNKGKYKTTSPIKDIMQVLEIKQTLLTHPRNLAIFVLGCNTGLRAGDLLQLRRDQLELLVDGRYDLLVVEQKTKKIRRITVNLPTSKVLKNYLDNSDGTYVFEGQRGKLSVSYVGRLIKSWCKEAGIEGRHATHTMRKTFVRTHYDRGTSLATLMKVMNHSSELQTLTYIGVIAPEIANVYASAI